MASKEKASLNQLLDALDAITVSADLARSESARQEYLKAQEAVCQELGWTLDELMGSSFGFSALEEPCSGIKPDEFFVLSSQSV